MEKKQIEIIPAYEGYPRATFFEIYLGEKDANKKFSVQVADWKKWISEHHPSSLRGFPAVYAGGDLLDKSKRDNVRVIADTELIDMLRYKFNVRIPTEVYVKVCAFEWRENTADGSGTVVNKDEWDTIEPETKSKSNNKALLMLGIAAAALLLGDR